ALPDKDRIIPAADLTKFIGDQSQKLDQDENTAKARAPIDQIEIQRIVAEKKRLSDLTANYQAIKNPNQIKICTTDGSPNDLPATTSPKCDDIERNEIRMDDNKIVLYAYLKQKFHGPVNSSSLEYGKNHFLCTSAIDKETKTTKDGCIRFSSYTPLFAFPHKAPNEVNSGYNDPEPFTVKNNVAIFGVFDRILGEQVGILNVGFQHTDYPELTSSVSAEDPAEALTQQLDYFAIKYPAFS